MNQKYIFYFSNILDVRDLESVCILAIAPIRVRLRKGGQKKAPKKKKTKTNLKFKRTFWALRILLNIIMAVKLKFLPSSISSAEYFFETFFWVWNWKISFFGQLTTFSKMTQVKFWENWKFIYIICKWRFIFPFLCSMEHLECWRDACRHWSIVISFTVEWEGIDGA